MAKQMVCVIIPKWIELSSSVPRKNDWSTGWDEEVEFAAIDGGTEWDWYTITSSSNKPAEDMIIHAVSCNGTAAMLV